MKLELIGHDEKYALEQSHGVTGGVYKTRERIHRDILIRDY